MYTALRKFSSAVLGIALITAFSSAKPSSTKVYICDSPTAYAYHLDKNCSGLRHCTHGVLTVTKDQAINGYGRRACKICAK